MENLTDAGNRPKRSGLARLKRIRDEMFKKKHQTLKEEDAKEGKQFISGNVLPFTYLYSFRFVMSLDKCLKCQRG